MHLMTAQACYHSRGFWLANNIAVTLFNGSLQMGSNMIGVMIGFGAVVVTAVYQVLAGSKQKELQASSMQLLHQYCPMAAICLAICVPTFEPLGIVSDSPLQTICSFAFEHSAHPFTCSPQCMHA